MNPILIATLTVITVTGVSVGLYFWWARDTLTYRKLVGKRLREMQTAQRDSQVAILRSSDPLKSILDRLLADRTLAQVVETNIRKSGVAWTTGDFAGLSLIGVAIGVMIGVAYDGLLGTVIALLLGLAPTVYVRFRHGKRIEKVETQFPEAVDIFVNALRAGYSVPAAMQFVGTEVPAPVGPEFARYYDEQRLGMDSRQALDGLQERLGTLDAKMFVLAILIQRETGGNLAEVLGNIGTIIRQRLNFRDHVKTLTAESSASAIILSALPVVIFLVLRTMNPEYMNEMTSKTAGKLMLVYALFSVVLGYNVLRSMAKVEI